MTALFLTVLLASLVGSLHCAGMCGAFVAFAIGAGEPSQSRGRLLALYQAGRLVTYTLLGATAGFVGAGIDLGGRLVGVQKSAAVLSGALMVGFGTITLLRLAGWKLQTLKLPTALTATISSGHRRAMRYSPPTRALATGLLTTLLPCGWLWAFVITSAGTGHALTGAALMATFWTGTLPIMTLVGMSVRKLAAPLAAKLPALTASAIVLVGIYTIVARAGVVVNPSNAAHTHGLTPEQLKAQIDAINEEQLPCCTSHPAEDGGGEK